MKMIFFYIYYGEFTSAPYGLSISQEYIVSKDLDFKYVLVKEDLLMNTSFSSPPYPLCSIVCNALTCDEHTSCSSSSSPDELTYQLT